MILNGIYMIASYMSRKIYASTFFETEDIMDNFNLISQLTQPFNTNTKIRTQLNKLGTHHPAQKKKKKIMYRLTVTQPRPQPFWTKSHTYC